MKKLAALAFAFASLAAASTITYVGPVTGANDGIYYTGPLNITVDGQSAVAMCIDSLHMMASQWEGTIVNVADIPLPDQIKYLEAEFLFQQFAINDISQYAAIQHAAWDIFNPSSSFSDGLPWEMLAAANYSSIDPRTSNVIFPTINGASQTVIGFNVVPEPGTMLLMGGALMAVRLVRRRRG